MLLVQNFLTAEIERAGINDLSKLSKGETVGALHHKSYLSKSRFRESRYRDDVSLVVKRRGKGKEKEINTVISIRVEARNDDPCFIVVANDNVEPLGSEPNALIGASNLVLYRVRRVFL
tara:strand:- start:538 stop:894 length:357 start_codon:yes stop_codon:yes gene_type:complete